MGYHRVQVGHLRVYIWDIIVYKLGILESTDGISMCTSWAS